MPGIAGTTLDISDLRNKTPNDGFEANVLILSCLVYVLQTGPFWIQVWRNGSQSPECIKLPER